MHDDADPEVRRRRTRAVPRSLAACSRRSRPGTFLAGSRDDMGGDLYDLARRARRLLKAIPLAERTRDLGRLRGTCATSPADCGERSGDHPGGPRRAGLRRRPLSTSTRAEIGIPVVKRSDRHSRAPSDAPDYVPGRRALGLLQFAD